MIHIKKYWRSESNLMWIGILYSKRSWPVVIPVYNGLTLRDPKRDFLLSVTAKHQKNKLHKRIGLEGDLIVTRCRITPHKILVAVKMQTWHNWAQNGHMWGSQITGSYIRIPSKKEKAESHSHPWEKNIHIWSKPPEPHTNINWFNAEVNKHNFTYERLSFVLLLVYTMMKSYYQSNANLILLNNCSFRIKAYISWSCRYSVARWV